MLGNLPIILHSLEDCNRPEGSLKDNPSAQEVSHDRHALPKQQ